MAEIQNARGIVQVADGNFNAPVPEHGIKPVEELCLLLTAGQVGAVGSGEVGEKTLGEDSGQPGNPGALVSRRGSGLKADPAHAGVQGEVEGRIADPQLHGGSGKGQGVLIMEDGGPDAVADGCGKGGYRSIAQNQNGIVQSGPPQLHGFQHGAHAEERAFVLEQPGNLNGAVTVGVGFDNGHHRKTCFFPDGIDVFFNGIQVDNHLGIVIIQANQLISRNSILFYH